jgi:RNA polymerase sigma-70 factor (ECF subfamily)
MGFLSEPHSPTSTRMHTQVLTGLTVELTGPQTQSSVVTSGYIGSSVSEEHGNASSRKRIIELYDLLRPSLHAYLCCLGMTTEQSEDIIQETFLRLVRHIGEQETEYNLRAWVYRVAHNLSMDLHRLQRRVTQTNGMDLHPEVCERADPGPDPEQQVILDERMRMLDTAVAQLTPKQRQCLLMRAEGLRYREIAKTLGISIQRVGELVQRAITLLEGAL